MLTSILVLPAHKETRNALNKKAVKSIVVNSAFARVCAFERVWVYARDAWVRVCAVGCRYVRWKWIMEWLFEWGKQGKFRVSLCTPRQTSPGENTETIFIVTSLDIYKVLATQHGGSDSLQNGWLHPYSVSQAAPVSVP